MATKFLLTIAGLSLTLLLASSGSSFGQIMELDREPTVVPIPVAGPNVIQGGVHKASPDSNKPHRLDVTPMMAWVDDSIKHKAAIVCVHGLGLHKGTYTKFGELMAKSGYAVYAMDVRGFGSFMELPGERRCDFPRCLDDVQAALEMVHKTHPALPVFLLGESMGGAIALRITSMRPDLVDGLISSVPGAERYGQTKNSIKVGMKLISAPNKEMNVTDVVVNQSTDKEELRQEWLKDPLARFMITPKELVQFQHFMVDNEHSAKNITKTPVLMVQGASDKLVRHDSNENIIKHIPSEDRQLVFVDQAEHLIFEEGQFNDDVITLVSTWLDKHIKPKQAAKLQYNGTR